MLEGILIYVCLLPSTEACKNTSQAYFVQNKPFFSYVETKAKNMAGPKVVAATPYLAFAVRQEASFVITRNVSVKMKKEEIALGYTYTF